MSSVHTETDRHTHTHTHTHTHAHTYTHIHTHIDQRDFPPGVHNVVHIVKIALSVNLVFSGPSLITKMSNVFASRLIKPHKVLRDLAFPCWGKMRPFFAQ